MYEIWYRNMIRQSILCLCQCRDMIKGLHQYLDLFLQNGTTHIKQVSQLIQFLHRQNIKYTCDKRPHPDSGLHWERRSRITDTEKNSCYNYNTYKSLSTQFAFYIVVFAIHSCMSCILLCNLIYIQIYSSLQTSET